MTAGRSSRSVRPLLLAAGAALAAAAPASRAEIPLTERRSGYELMSAETKAMQDEDSVNPGMLWVLDGEALWTRKAGPAERACGDCHGDAKVSMRGVAARYPAFSEAAGRPINLEQRINECWSERQGAKLLSYESREMLGLTSYVAHQSRGMPIAPPQDERLAPFRERGRVFYESRQGQLNLSCAQCHDDNWGRRLAGNPIPQAHPTGYPQYRLEWQAVGSLQRRLRNCLVGMRAEAYPYGAPEYVDLELHLMARAAGMAIETPAVRP
jgi:L-cysteine S-thiosulfotransferase